MRIENLLIKNFRCFSHLDVDFTNNDNPSQKIVFLGKNGNGKTTILQAVALLLSGSETLIELMGKPDKWIKHEAKSAMLSCTISDVNQGHTDIELTINRNEKKHAFLLSNKEQLRKLDDFRENAKEGSTILGYGAHLRLSGSNIASSKRRIRFKETGNISTLFDAQASLNPLESWMMDLDYRNGLKAVSKVKSTINNVLRDVELLDVNKEIKSILFRTFDGKEAYNNIGYGHKIISNLIGDILFRLKTTGRELSNASDADFILLLDEPGIHLHPEWQSEILDSLSTSFTNAQIIATAHGPRISAQADKLFLLNRSQDGEIYSESNEDLRDTFRSTNFKFY